jgi:O-antigen ligase
VTKPDLVNRIFVGLFSACIALFIIFSAYYRKGVKAVLLLSFISLTIICFREKKFKISAFLEQYFSPRYVPFIFFGISVLISTIFSKDFKHSVEIFFERYFFYFLVFEIGRRLFSSKIVARTLDEHFGINIFESMKYIFISAGLFMGTGGIVDYVRFHPERLFSVFGHKIEFLMLPVYITCFLPVVYCFMFKENTFLQRFFAILAFFMLFMSMIFTGSRALWVAGPISILFASFLINNKHLKYSILGLSVFVCLIYFFVPIRMNNFDTYFFRQDIMQAAFNIFKDYPVFGAGPGMYEKLVYSYSKGEIYIHAHSTYLEILAEIGIVGLTAFLAIFINFYLRFFKNISIFNESVNKFLFKGLLVSNFACLIFAVFNSTLTVGFHDAPLFWLIFGMSFGLEIVLSENSSLKHERISDG